ncbi:BQ2448_299 [Microbotryum intermedium]|uniref:BQ2448_299 protein n=1 Tax=Microbotryum intermedium TaxID=269621 RepID=A0A238FAM5_9BASI|nr:BQ2448_299 [Microbotryum intermedium]
MSSSDTQGSLIVSIPDVQVAHLSRGVSTPLAAGTLQLVNVTVASLATAESASSPTTTSQKTKSGAPSLPAQLLPSSSSSSSNSFLLMTLQVPGETEPIFELVLAPESRILSEAPSSYIVPNYQPGASEVEQANSGSIKVTLPFTIDTGSRETFEHVLWGMTSFASTSSTNLAASSGLIQPPAYSHSDYGTAPSLPTGGATTITPSTNDLRSQLVLVDSSGNLVGTLADNVSLHEDASLAQEHQGQNEKEPVIVEVSALTSSGTNSGATTPTSGGGHHFDFSVRPLSAFNQTPNPSNSTIITWGDYLSHGIIVGGELVSRTIELSADTFVSKRAATSKPLVFSETTKNRTAQTTAYSGQVVKVSNKAAKMVGDAAAKVGDRIGKATGIQTQPSGKAPRGLKGLVNKSLIAFNNVLDATETTAKQVLVSGGQSSTKVIQHALGNDAAQVSAYVGAVAQNVFLVYLDARGVSRRALLKGVGKGALRCKMQDGREVVLTDDEGQSPNATVATTTTSEKAALTKQ